MEVFECIDTRRSVRNYGKGDIPLGKLVQILDAGTDAPSAGNTQPWEFIIVTDKKIKDEIFDVSLKQDHVKQAPVLIVVLAVKKRSELRFGERGKNFYCIQDTAACIQNMLLATHSLGLAGCWVGAFDEIRLKSVLKILDDDIKPVAILTIGNKIPYIDSPKPNRISMDKIIWAEKYGEKPKWILKPQRKHRFDYAPLDQQLIKAKEKIDKKITELSEKDDKDTKIEKKEKKPVKKTLTNFLKRLTR